LSKKSPATFRADASDMLPLCKRDKESFRHKIAVKTAACRASRPISSGIFWICVFCLSTFHPISVNEASVQIRKNSMEKYREISPTR